MHLHLPLAEGDRPRYGGQPMMCDHCGQPIRPGEKVRKYAKDSASGGGMDVILHERPCRKPPTQTYPSH